MPREHESRREILQAIQSLPSVADLAAVRDGRFQHELDLEVVVYGRNYNGRKIGPYVRLLTYEPWETIVREGDWGGNSFYLVVSGQPEVFRSTPDRGEVRISEVPRGRQFGEISVLAGVPHSSTVRAPDEEVRLLEVQRPALRLLRKLSGFSQSLDRTYLRQSLKAAYQRINLSTELTESLIAHGGNLSRFGVFAKNHVLFRERSRVDFLYVIQDGWLRRSQDQGASGGEVLHDYLGYGHCFGLDGVMRQVSWPYTVTLMGRSEVLMISISQLREKPALRDALIKELSRFSAPAIIGESLARVPEARAQLLETQERLINTGLVDGTNLLVMDMDLCVRCGRCSLACHQIHGQSRLLRRGINITRTTQLEAKGKNAVQQVLAPSVCLHCKDPECLTGCPTGAIGRHSPGQIDIDRNTCIGCGDCAANCPYHAISMVPRNAEAGDGKKDSWRQGLKRWRHWLSVAPDPLPPAVDQTDDLLAVKCNLCTGTTLNPAGSKSPAYGCEENCPTGALARINPRQYFSEIKQIEGLAFVDQTHAVGRNIHQSDPFKRLLHCAGILLVVVATMGALIGIERYGLGARMLGFLNMRWITGLAGLIGIGALMTYPIRRQIYKRRSGPLRYWMLAHSYLGVMTGIILLLHGGTDSGAFLTMLLRGSFDMVILSGLFGIVCYFAVPRLLSEIEGEPLLLDDLKARRTELQQEIATIAGSSSEAVCNAVTERVLPRLLSTAYLLRQYVKREKLDALLGAAKEEFKPMTAGLDNKQQGKLLKAVEAAATLRRVEALILLHRLLKAWLPPHVIFTSLMLALMVIHVIQVVSGK